MNNKTNNTMRTLVMMLMMVLAAIAGPIAIAPASNAEDQTAFPTEVREVPQLNTLTRARNKGAKKERPSPERGQQGQQAQVRQRACQGQTEPEGALQRALQVSREPSR